MAFRKVFDFVNKLFFEFLFSVKKKVRMSTPHNININDGDVNVDDSIVDQMDFIENLANIVPAKDVEMVKQFQKNM